MKKSLLIALALLIGCSTFAQDYKQSIGLHIGGSVTANYKTFMSRVNALDVEAGFQFTGGNGIFASAAYEWHWDLNVGVDGLTVFAGPGATASLTFAEGGNSSIGVGVFAIGGIEYTFPSWPIVISLDYKPTLYLVPNVAGGWSNGGLSIRYIF